MSTQAHMGEYWLGYHLQLVLQKITQRHIECLCAGLRQSYCNMLSSLSAVSTLWATQAWPTLLLQDVLNIYIMVICSVVLIRRTVWEVGSRTEGLETYRGKNRTLSVGKHTPAGCTTISNDLNLMQCLTISMMVRVMYNIKVVCV